MENWKLISIAVLLPLNLSGMMLFLVASRLSTLTVERRLHLGIAGLFLMAPGIILMLLTAQRREDTVQDEDEDEDDEVGVEGPYVQGGESVANSPS